MIDTGEVDDKIVAVLKDDSVCVALSHPQQRVTLGVSRQAFSLFLTNNTDFVIQFIRYGHITTISELPAGVVDRLRHYFLT